MVAAPTSQCVGEGLDLSNYSEWLEDKLGQSRPTALCVYENPDWHELFDMPQPHAAEIPARCDWQRQRFSESL